MNQLNHGAALVTSREERERVAELNLMAGKRAQRSTAYASALRYFAAGARDPRARIAGRDATSSRSRSSSTGRSASSLTGELEAAEQRLVALTARAASVVDAAAVACLQVDLYTTSGQSPRAVEACLAYLRRVGIDWSAHPTNEEVQRRVRADVDAARRPRDRGRWSTCRR